MSKSQRRILAVGLHCRQTEKVSKSKTLFILQYGRYLSKFPRLQKVVDWITENFELVKKVPNYLVPKFFYYVVMTLYCAARERIVQMMPSFIAKGDIFVKSLALGSVQMVGITTSTGLHPKDTIGSMAAGLPHFSTHHMRCWGRDVFISLRGLLLLTGRFQEAKAHIKAFASVLKHGLVPNLLDAGRKPRYNARDAVWWCLQAIKEYCEFAPEGLSFLKEKVALRFPDDEFIDSNDPKCFSKEITIEDFIQNVLERHARGIKFREWNAGSNLDHVMRSEGFEIEVGTDWNTGFVYGGNMYNCGTWMDKMGESKTANTCGNPATPRDGSAVEIVGLSMSSISWVAGLSDKGMYSYESVKKPGKLISKDLSLFHNPNR